MTWMRSSTFDPNRFPRFYTPSLGWQVFAWVLGGGLGVVSLVGVWYFGTGHEWKGAEAALIMCCVCLALAALGFGCLLGILAARLTLAPTFIESRSMRTRRLCRSDIADYRIFNHQGISEYRIRASSRKRLFKFTLVFKVDSDFMDWFADLKNADQIAFDNELQEVARDDNLGANPTLRLESSARARRTAALLSLAAFVMTFWTFVYPRPYAVLLSLDAALPVLAMLLCWRFSGLFTLAGRKQSVRGDLAGLLIGPGIALALRAMLDITLIRPAALLLPSTIAGIVLACLAFSACADLRKYPGTALLYTLFLGVYAAGALALGNSSFDLASPRREVVTIVAMRHTTGKGASAYFSLSRVPNDLGSSEISVPFSLYRRKQISDLVCISEHKGAFGWRWVRVDDEAVCRSG
jgi:hypothetical protein